MNRLEELGPSPDKQSKSKVQSIVLLADRLRQLTITLFAYHSLYSLTKIALLIAETKNKHLQQ